MIFMNLDSSKKQMQYVLKRARKVAAELTPCGALRREGLSFAIASLEDSKHDLADQLGQKRPCSQPPVRPSTALTISPYTCSGLASGPEWRATAAWVPKRDCSGAAAPAQSHRFLTVLGPSRRTTGSCLSRPSTYA